MAWFADKSKEDLVIDCYALTTLLFLVLIACIVSMYISTNNLTKASETVVVLDTIVRDSENTIKYLDDYDFYAWSVDGEVKVTAKTLEELLEQMRGKLDD